MASSNPTVSNLQRAVKDTVHSYWQLFLTQGVMMVILGILAVVWPQISTVAVGCVCRLAVPAQRHCRDLHDVPGARRPGVSVDAPPDVAKSVTRIIGLGMTYDGYLAAAAPGAAVVLDRDLNVKDYVTFGGEAVDNSICINDKGGIYVVTSKRMLRLAWTGQKLSPSEAGGAWESSYEAMDPEKAMAMGAISCGSGASPTLMGFGDDPDKLVLIADAAEKEPT